MKEDLKSRGFRFNPDYKLWYRTPLEESPMMGIEAFDLGGCRAQKVIHQIGERMSTVAGGGKGDADP